MKHTVTVTSTWEAEDTLEFDTEEEANAAREALNAGQLPETCADGMNAGGATLTDWRAS